MTSIFTLQHNSEGKFYRKINILINPTLDSKGEVFVACVNEGGDYRKYHRILIFIINPFEGRRKGKPCTRINKNCFQFFFKSPD